jgi:hypothetical protein
MRAQGRIILRASVGIVREQVRPFVRPFLEILLAQGLTIFSANLEIVRAQGRIFCVRP